ncbi:MAG: ATP-binding protein [Bacteroidales bacterium]|nr:ATP-binding protein [Bacteroidales bacterium]MBN2821364.1 ATP-binding protein [Bacteroidales bacterium]
MQCLLEDSKGNIWARFQTKGLKSLSESLPLIVRNLLSNAIKFLPVKVNIDVQAEKDIINNTTIIKITDSDPGIDNETIERIMSSKPVKP